MEKTKLISLGHWALFQRVVVFATKEGDVVAYTEDGGKSWDIYLEKEEE